MKNDRNKEPGGKQIRSPEDLMAFAQEYYSGEFPNPDREGCPGIESIESMVQSETLPGEEMRLHLFSCSDCFSEYREAVAVYKNAPRRRPVSLWRFPFFDFKPQPLPGVVAVALLTLLMISGVIFYNLDRHSKSSSIMQSESRQTPSPVDADPNPPSNLLAKAEPPATDNRLLRGARPRQQSKINGRYLRPSITPVEVRINLREDVMREAEGGHADDDVLIELPPRRTSLIFDLPDNSSKGHYEVKIVDPFGKQLISSNSSSRDGKTLRVSLDLRGLAEARYRLCVSHHSEAPNCYQFTISSKALKR